jgi:hypothetical protein
MFLNNVVLLLYLLLSDEKIVENHAALADRSDYTASSTPLASGAGKRHCPDFRRSWQQARHSCVGQQHTAITITEVELELVAERKVRHKQLTDDGNVEITGRDLRARNIQERYPRPVGYHRAASARGAQQAVREAEHRFGVGSWSQSGQGLGKRLEQIITW